MVLKILTLMMFKKIVVQPLKEILSGMKEQKIEFQARTTYMNLICDTKINFSPEKYTNEF